MTIKFCCYLLDFQIEGTDLNLHLTSPNIQQFQAMFNDGAPEFVVDQNLYYPAATNYGYYCTGKIRIICLGLSSWYIGYESY